MRDNNDRNKILAQVVNKTKSPNKAQANKIDEY